MDESGAFLRKGLVGQGIVPLPLLLSAPFVEVAGWDLESQSVGFWLGLLITREPLKQFRSCLQWRHSVFVFVCDYAWGISRVVGFVRTRHTFVIWGRDAMGGVAWSFAYGGGLKMTSLL